MTEASSARQRIPWALSVPGRWLCAYALVGGAVTFAGWPLDVPRLTDWLNTGVSVQPNAAVLVLATGLAIGLGVAGVRRGAQMLGAAVSLTAALVLAQYVIGVDLGFNHQLLFGRTWGQATTLTPGRVGPPASSALACLGAAVVMLGFGTPKSRRMVPALAITAIAIAAFSIVGYLFGARQFFALPWLTAIALPMSTFLIALASAVLLSVPEHEPVRTLRDQSVIGHLARRLTAVLVITPLVLGWLRTKGEALGYYDAGTGRSILILSLIAIPLAVLWQALRVVRLHELARQRSDAALQKANRQKDEFLAILAHELRNPLAPLRTTAALLEQQGNLQPTVLARAAAVITRQTRQMARLLDDLLDVTRLSRGRLTLQRTDVLLRDVLTASIETSRPLIERFGHRLEHTSEVDDVTLHADPARLTQVFANLLNNAATYTPPGGRIEIAATRAGDEAIIRVRDSGVGIPAELQARLFEPFTRGEQRPAEGIGGLGLGLALARQFVELHRGTIRVANRPDGEGAEFTVALPMTTRGAGAAASVQAARSASHRTRVLVVDDTPDVADTLALLLESYGCDARTVYTGEAALSHANDFRPDVAFVDLGLPDIDGCEVCHRLRQADWGRAMVIVALTGWGRDADRQRTDAAGFDRHLTKPVDPEMLRDILAAPATAANRAGGGEGAARVD